MPERRPSGAGTTSDRKGARSGTATIRRTASERLLGLPTGTGRGGIIDGGSDLVTTRRAHRQWAAGVGESWVVNSGPSLSMDLVAGGRVRARVGWLACVHAGGLFGRVCAREARVGRP